MRVLCRLMGGLGNQMFQYAAARALALDRGALLEFDTRNLAGSEPHETLALDHFATKLRMAPGWRLPMNGRAPGKLRVPRLLRHYRREFFSKPIYDPRIHKFQKTVELRGHFQSEKYFAHQAKQIREDFTIKAQPSPETSRWLDRINASPMPVSVHYRRGDFLKSSKNFETFSQCGVAYYAEAIAQLERQFDSIDLFIFSDDPDWVKANTDFSHPTHFVDCNDTVRQYDDLRLMSACHHNIIANSTFSWWAAWLNSRKDKQVFIPDRWYRTPDFPGSDLWPDGWIKLPVCDPRGERAILQ